MKHLTASALVFTLISLAGLALHAQTSEQVLEECMLEADRRGYDIQSDSFVDRLAHAIVDEDGDTVREICPETYDKYSD